jgi:hypothetical protein
MSGKIEWLASFGSLIRLDAISLGLALNQQSSTVLTPSQHRVPEGEKIRKEDMREKEKRSLTNIIDLKVKEVKKKAKRVKNREIMLDDVANLKIKSNNDTTK